MRFIVQTTDSAKEDLELLTDALLERAETAADFDYAMIAVQAIGSAIGGLARSALRCRKAGDGHDPFLRELVIPFGHTGYIALFEVVGDMVLVAAIRHQREDDYY